VSAGAVVSIAGLALWGCAGWMAFVGVVSWLVFRRHESSERLPTLEEKVQQWRRELMR
jgi:hypothetical protein